MAGIADHEKLQGESDCHQPFDMPGVERGVEPTNLLEWLPRAGSHPGDHRFESG